ncbi:BTAD domain-containing putative transcriptional regulator [Phytomonospora sp. NPDC050363]|uniref:AfsR/SARP family transcriptional regulator n=1 Tax=Phytomonospora sp. NPDC050363 TaxID=3155642 RepID=UPI0033E3EC7E
MLRPDGGTAEIRSRTRRAILAILLADAGHVVPVERLADRLWGTAAPARARDNLYSYVSRLRSELAALGADLPERRAAGYTLRAGPSTLDLLRFRELAAAARAAEDDAPQLFASALALWRGEAFEGLDLPWLNDRRHRLDAELHAVRLDRNDAVLRSGGHTGLLPELRELARAHPWDERLAGQVMLALHRSGRTAGALEHYGRLRDRSRHELGNEPGPALRELHRRILADTAQAAVAPAGTPVPRQLPAPPRRFEGRAAQLAALSAGDPRGAVRLVCGPGGIGKTWLALRWAHDALDLFPDGQLYLDLRGFSATEDPLPTGDALRGLLVGLGAEPGAVPATPEAQVALYRRLLAGRRILVVLDNAHDSEQVVPLLPGGAEATTIITSRNDLTGVGVAHGGTRVVLEPMDDPEAHAVLGAHLGLGRLHGEPAAAAELVGHCAGLPLALGILAARVAARPGFPLSVYAEEIRRDTAGLGPWEAGPHASLRAALDGSRKHLDAEAEAAFTLLGVAPGTDLGLAMIAALTGRPPAETRAVLAALEEAGLLREHRPGRYLLHDLTKAYTAELAGGLADGEREAALRRLAEHALRAAAAADRRLAPHRDRIEVDAPVSPEEEFGDEAGAWRWFIEERETALGLVRASADAGFDTLAWRLAWAITAHLHRQGMWDAQLAVMRVGLDAARRVGDLDGMSRLHSNLARAYSDMQRPAAAREHLREAAEIARRGGWVRSRAFAELGLGTTYSDEDEPARALKHASRALDLFTEAGSEDGQGLALNLAAWARLQLGAYDTAVEQGRRALELFERSGSPRGVASVLDTIGRALHMRGAHAEAVGLHRRASELFGEAGDLVGEALVSRHLGDAEHAGGDTAAARRSWTRSERIFARLGRSEAAELRARLAETGPADGETAPGGSGG